MHKYGIIIMSGFAALWFMWGLSGFGPVPLAWALVPLAISGAMIVLALRIPVHMGAGDRAAMGRIVGWASAIEGMAIFVAANVLNWTGHPGYLICATAGIVGLHFLPLAHLFRVRAYYATGAMIVALAAAGCAVDELTTRLLVVGVGTALLLWATCATAFGRKGHGTALAA